MRSFVTLIVVVLTCAGCAELPPTPDANDHEVVTTIELTLIQNQPPRDTIFVRWQDKDGPGGNAPDIVDTMWLDSGRTYYTTIRVLNASVTPTENMTETIASEEINHQFFYAFDPTTLGATRYLDKDGRDLPVGLSIDISALAPGNGMLTVELSHYPDFNDKDGVQKSTDTDISIQIPVIVRP